MATKEMTIKLMIDPESNRLIFAEASKDFVDFLIYLLSLPIGTVTKLLTSESMVGSIGNIYTSVTNLDKTYLRPYVKKDVILNPKVSSSPINTPLSVVKKSYINSSRLFFTCGDPECKRGITNKHSDVLCPGCNGEMYKRIKFIDKDTGGYVESVASYMVSDDLSLTSISTMSIVSLLNKFNVTKPEERVVKIGSKEALELLNASLQSTTVLTDVFLKRKKRKQPDNGPRKMQIVVKTLEGGLSIPLEVELSDTVYDVKAQIEVMDGTPIHESRLIFGGRELENYETLADYNVVDKSVFFNALCLRGCW